MHENINIISQRSGSHKGLVLTGCFFFTDHYFIKVLQWNLY